MNKPRPLWPWIVVTLIGLPLLYVFSLGPIYWWAVRGDINVSEDSWAWHLYFSPARLAYRYGPQPMKDALDWWILDVWRP